MAAPPTIRPAFSNRYGAWRFVALVMAIVASPLALAWHPPDRDDVYRGVEDGNGPFSFIGREIFERTEPIDVLVLGSSISWAGVDATIWQQALSEHLGRKAVVVNFGSNWRGEDLLYFQLRDLLQRRQVRLLLYSTPGSSETQWMAHSQAYHWLDGEWISGSATLSWRLRVQLYGLQVLGAPRQMLMWIRHELGRPADAPGSVDSALGSLRAARGLRGAPFVPFAPLPVIVAADSLVATDAQPAAFQFSSEPLAAYGRHFVMGIAGLVNRHHVPVVGLHVTRFSEERSSVIRERTNWSQIFGRSVPLLGISAERLFAALSDDEIRLLYYDDHFNVNGSEFFTRTMTPGLLGVYDADVNQAR